MPTNSADFIGDIPTYYDTGLGPNIFYDYADRLAQRCAILEPKNVLELAAGTGILSRRLRNVLTGGTQLVATDLNAPMLAVAQSKFTQDEAVNFNVADAMGLPFEDNAFDLMVCQFGIMFFPDKPASFREAARVLRPGGHYVFNTWGAMLDNPFAQMAHEVCGAFFPDDPPGFYKIPFHYNAPDDVRADLAAAGWHQIEHEVIALSKTIADPKAFATALVYGNPLIDEIRQRGGVDPDAVVGAMYSALYERFGPAPLVMPLQATTFICKAP